MNAKLPATFRLSKESKVALANEIDPVKYADMRNLLTQVEHHYEVQHRRMLASKKRDKEVKEVTPDES